MPSLSKSLPTAHFLLLQSAMKMTGGDKRVSLIGSFDPRFIALRDVCDKFSNNHERQSWENHAFTIASQYKIERAKPELRRSASKEGREKQVKRLIKKLDDLEKFLTLTVDWENFISQLPFEVIPYIESTMIFRLIIKRFEDSPTKPPIKNGQPKHASKEAAAFALMRLYENVTGRTADRSKNNKCCSDFLKQAFPALGHKHDKNFDYLGAIPSKQ